MSGCVSPVSVSGPEGCGPEGQIYYLHHDAMECGGRHLNGWPGMRLQWDVLYKVLIW